MKSILLTLLCFFSFVYINSAQNYPGGVTGAEVWYVGDKEGIQQGEFINSAQTDINVKQCGEATYNLFNFNASIFSEKLCLQYTAPLENTTGRNVFFVGEPSKNKYSFSHLATETNSSAQTDSIVRNEFNFNNKNVYGSEIYSEYTSDQNAHVNFYHSNHYNIDKKFKSYGQEGESTFYIGKETSMGPEAESEDLSFFGNFPEFVSFPREISDNERNRVESYLALKYGLALNKNTSYLNSKNIVFWDTSNNDLFRNRIFGFGKDDTSNLLQLQSESTHLKNHLVSAIDKIMETNMEKQESIEIPNDHFLVFGDNGGKLDFVNENEHGIEFWDKVWLAQRTGKSVHEFPIYYKLSLDNQLVEMLEEQPGLKLWLMQDKYVGNDEVSEFDSEQIVYYPAEVNFDEGFAYFSDVFFDDDLSAYDQFTFGVGPEMIVQTQVKGCEKDDLELVLDITGGEPEYYIDVESDAGSFETEINGTSYTFAAVPGVTYNITVQDSQGLVSEVEITPEPWSFSLDLGPDQYLSASQPQVTLDAGGGIDDPDATYEWYLEGVLLPDTGSTLTVSEVGYYQVVVTSGDLSCVVKDGIKVLYKEFEAHLTSINGCDRLFNSLTVHVENGFPDYVTSLEGVNGTINYAHSSTTTITDIPYGSYIVTVTDSVGEIYVSTVDFVAPIFELDLVSQLDAICNSCLQYPGDPGYPDYLGYDLPFFSHGTIEFTIDGSVSIPSPTATYQWFLNDLLISEQPTLTFDADDPNYCYSEPPYDSVGVKIIRLEVSDLIDNNCFVSESFIFKGYCPNNDAAPAQAAPLPEEETDFASLKTRIHPNPSSSHKDFTYEVSATEDFDATVELLTLTGVRLYSEEISGSSTYVLSFNLRTSGLYLLRTTSSLGIVKTDKIIIK